jgi:hypothetical protein
MPDDHYGFLGKWQNKHHMETISSSNRTQWELGITKITLQLAGDVCLVCAQKCAEWCDLLRNTMLPLVRVTAIKCNPDA